MQLTRLNLRFLKNLKQKLETDHRRSIYLDVLAEKQHFTKMDLCDLELIKHGLSNFFLDTLLSTSSNSFDITIALEQLNDEKIKKVVCRLNDMLEEDKNYSSNYGVKTFSFGFPVLVKRDQQHPHKIIKAPLFIWSLSLERNRDKRNTWSISWQKDAKITSNLPLAIHVLQDTNVQIAPLYNHLINDGLLNKDELAALLARQLRPLLTDSSEELRQLFRKHLNQPPRQLPTNKTIEVLELEQPVVLWSGLFGSFPAQKGSILKDINQLISNIDQFNNVLTTQIPPKGHTSFMKHTFSILPTTPSQQRLLHLLEKGNNLIIESPSGIAKAQTLTGIISNIISNGGRCLVVGEKTHTLDALHKNLKLLGLEELVATILDPDQARSSVLKSVTRRLQYPTLYYKPSPSFIRILQSCAIQVQRLQKYMTKLSEPICGHDCWATVVAKYIQLQQDFPKERLDRYLNTTDFKFNSTELESTLRILEEGEFLFKALGSLQHPFNAFHERFFTRPNTHQVVIELKESVDNLLFAVESAQNELLTYLYQYEQLLEDHYSTVFMQKSRLADEIIDMTENGLKSSKFFFNKNKGAYRNLLSGFSKKHKQLKEDQLVILKNYTLLKKLHERYAYFEYDFIPIAQLSNVTFENIKKNTTQYVERVSDWYIKKDPVIREYVNQLKIGFVHPHTDFRQQTQEITRNLDLFAQNFIRSQVFKVPFQFRNDIIRDRLDSLEELDNNLKKLAQNFETEFLVYHPLKFFWLNLTRPEQAALEGMANAKVDNWEHHFKSWYYHHLLSAHADEYIPKEKEYRRVVQNLKKEEKELQKGLKDHSINYWRSKQQTAVQQFNQSKYPLKVHDLYNEIGKQPKAISQLFEADDTLFTSFFPIVMASPAVCAATLPLQPNLFDVVIFDAANQLKIEDTFSTLIRGKHKIIVGNAKGLPPLSYLQDANTTPPQKEINLKDLENYEQWTLEHATIDKLSNSASLLEYGIATGGYKKEFLKFQSGSKHPYLWDFSNAAFYNKQLCIPPHKAEHLPIHFHSVKGIYENGVNTIEAQAIVDHLVQIAQKKTASDSIIPSIGILTFSPLQQTYILNLLQNLTIQANPHKNLINSLFEAGLFVKNIDMLQENTPEVLFMSTTFAPKVDGSFSQDFGSINRLKGYRLLNIAISSAKKEIQLYCSIPPNYYKEYQTLILEQDYYSKAIFYAYLSYAQAVSEQDEKSRQTILNLVFNSSHQKSNTLLKDSLNHAQMFEDLVTDFLNLELKDYHIIQHTQFAGLPIPLLIRNSTKYIALYFDLSDEHYSEEAYAWNIFKEEYLQKLGVKVGRVWSYSWWHAPKAEQTRLLKFIKEQLS